VAAPYASAFGTGGPQPGYGQPQPPPYAPPPQVNPYAFPPEAAREAPPKVLRGFLVAYGTNPSGDFWPLTGGRHTIGRFGTGDGLEIALQDPTISSRHAAIVVDGSTGVVGLEDTGSTNGTFVNDEHIGYGGRRELKDGDRIRFGGFTTVVKVIGRV
jgi:pSer/pThr/pTyr-binding forkhead associated (FHA) protein